MLSLSVLLAVAALCALAYATLTLVSGWLRRRMADARTEDEMIAVANKPVALAQSWVVLLSMFVALVAYFGAAALAFSVSPPLAVLGFVFCVFWVLTELLYRSVELFAVTRAWIPRYLAEGDATLKATLKTMIVGFYDVVAALYFVLLSGHLLGSALLGVGLWLVGGWAQIASIALLVNALRLLLRILEMHLGQRWLSPFNTRAYTVLVFLIFCALGVGLGLQSGAIRP
jgi:hypothetical protein